MVATVRNLRLEDIEAGRTQAVDTDAMLSLTASIRTFGVLNPIRVKEMGAGHYSVIAGHRRFEAARAAGQTTIPAVITPPDEATIGSLMESIKRQSLAPLDEARTYKALLAETGWSQSDLARFLGRKQSGISNSLRLLTLAPAVQAVLAARSISVSHAKAVAILPHDEQAALVGRIVEERLLTKAVEGIVRQRRAAR